MTKYNNILEVLVSAPKKWVITGVAGFIGSNLLESLLRLNQKVVGLDNLSTGKFANLEEVRENVTEAQWAGFEFIKGDVCNIDDCVKTCIGSDYILHQAALGSVPRSIADPLRSHSSNVNGFINILEAAKAANAKQFVFASSSSVYGDHPALPKVEDAIGRVLSPYAATKLIDEIYAEVYNRCYGIPTIGLRYFNVFGPRQDPAGAYAAVIPKWFAGIYKGEEIVINGDGETSRDFCYIQNVIQANILSACSNNAKSQVFNIAVGNRITLNELLKLMLDITKDDLEGDNVLVTRLKERAGDVKHSQADISKARTILGYHPIYNVAQGLSEALLWYRKRLLALKEGEVSSK